MNRVWMKRLSVPLLLALGATGVGSANAATLNDIYRAADQINGQAKQSQARIDALTDETRNLLNDYKTVLKEIEGLRVYNRQLERQITSQEKEKGQITGSIDQVTVIERQIGPLMTRMVDGLEQFVSLDLPFLQKERNERVEMLRETMDRADVAVSEKLSQVLRAYQIENEYGRTMEAYGDNITIDGVELKVDVLKVGRVALVTRPRMASRPFASTRLPAPGNRWTTSSKRRFATVFAWPTSSCRLTCSRFRFKRRRVRNNDHRKHVGSRARGRDCLGRHAGRGAVCARSRGRGRRSSRADTGR